MLVLLVETVVWEVVADDHQSATPAQINARPAGTTCACACACWSSERPVTD